MNVKSLDRRGLISCGEALTSDWHKGVEVTFDGRVVGQSNILGATSRVR